MGGTKSETATISLDDVSKKAQFAFNIIDQSQSLIDFGHVVEVDSEDLEFIAVALTAQRVAIEGLRAQVERLRAERDAAQARAERWIKLHEELGESYDRMFTDASQLSQERDAARAEVERLKLILARKGLEV